MRIQCEFISIAPLYPINLYYRSAPNVIWKKSYIRNFKILSISLIDKSHLADLFRNSKFNNVKDLNGLMDLVYLIISNFNLSAIIREH